MTVHPHPTKGGSVLSGRLNPKPKKSIKLKNMTT